MHGNILYRLINSGVLQSAQFHLFRWLFWRTPSTLKIAKSSPPRGNTKKNRIELRMLIARKVKFTTVLYFGVLISFRSLLKKKPLYDNYIKDEDQPL